MAQKTKLDTFINQCGSREWVSIIECISIDGDLLPAFIIFKAKVQKQAWIDELEKGNTIAINDKGWTNNTLGLEWFKRTFDPYSKKRQQGDYRLLLFDGHASHITNNVIRFCENKDIILLYLPPHTTYVLQPLDVGFFQPFNSRYQTVLVNRMKYDRNAVVDKCQFVRLY